MGMDFSNSTKLGRTLMIMNLAYKSLLALGVAMALSGCPNPQGNPANSPATIQFEQVGACSAYVDGNTTTSTGPNSAYVVFKVLGIDNTQNPGSFGFDPSRMSIESRKATFNNTLSLARLVAVPLLQPTVIPAKQATALNRYAFFVVTTDDANGAAEANATNYKLRYSRQDVDPFVSFTKAGPTSWPVTANCREIQF